MHCVGRCLTSQMYHALEAAHMPSGSGRSIKIKETRNVLGVSEALFDFILH